MINRLWDLLFPPSCILCGRLLEREETDLCRKCREEAPEYRNRKSKLQFLDSFTAVWYYEGNVRKSLLRYKFGGAHAYSGCYGRLLAMKVMEQIPGRFDIVTWVPISPLRRFRRGYDQGELLAKAVGSELGIETARLLRKVHHNLAQSGIRDHDQRRENVRGVYRAVSGKTIAGRKVLLLDDILTTGSTAGEAARVLRAAGAKEVHCAVMAAARKE